MRFLISILFILSFSLSACNTSETHKTQEAVAAGPAEKPVSTEKAPFRLQLRDAQGQEIAMELPAISESLSVMAFMEALRDQPQSPLRFETKSVPGIGEFIETMMDLQSGSEGGKYWMYCVNDTAAAVGASDRIIHPGDRVQWHFVFPKELPCKKVGE